MIAIRSHSRSAWAMTCVEKMIVAPCARLAPDQLFQSALIDRVEPSEWLVEYDQPRLVNDGAEQLDGLRHALREVADRLFRPIAKAVRLEQLFRPAPPFAKRQSAQRADEGDRITRMHRRIKAALLGQITDLGSGIERMLVAEDPPRSARRIDDPEQHPQASSSCPRHWGQAGRRLSPRMHGEADAVDRARLVEILDEVDRFDRIIRGAEPVEARKFLRIPTRTV